MTLSELADRAAIEDLVKLYARGVDRRDFALLRTLYHPDAIDDHGSYYCGPASGYVDWLEAEALAHMEMTNHYISNHLIVLNGDRAEGEVYMAAYHRFPDGKGGAMDLLTGGRYLDKYEKRDGLWRFSHRKIAQDWNALAPTQSTFDAEHSDPKNRGTNTADDPSHAFFELLPVRKSRRG